MRNALTALAAGLLLVACDGARTDFPVRTDAIRAEVEEMSTNVVVVKLTADNVDAFNTKRDLSGSRASLASDGWNYRIGVGDVLDVTVWDHPELNQDVNTGRSVEQAGQRVQADGTFYYPYVGQVPARGKTPEQIRDDLAKRLVAFFPDPQIEVRVASYKSQSVSVTGEVGNPSRQPLTDVPLTLLDAIDAAGGLTETADPRAVTIRRGGRRIVPHGGTTLEAGDVLAVIGDESALAAIRRLCTTAQLPL